MTHPSSRAGVDMPEAVARVGTFLERFGRQHSIADEFYGYEGSMISTHDLRALVDHARKSIPAPDCDVCAYRNGTHWPYCTNASPADVENLRARGGHWYEERMEDVLDTASGKVTSAWSRRGLGIKPTAADQLVVLRQVATEDCGYDLDGPWAGLAPLLEEIAAVHVRLIALRQ